MLLGIMVKITLGMPIFRIGVLGSGPVFLVPASFWVVLWETADDAVESLLPIKCVPVPSFGRSESWPLSAFGK